MEERRREARMRSLLTGRILYDQSRCTLDCTIRNLSQQGAMVVLSETFRVPENLALSIPSRDTAYDAKLIWRRGRNAGLAWSAVQGVTEARTPRTYLQGSRRRERHGMTLGY